MPKKNTKKTLKQPVNTKRPYWFLLALFIVIVTASVFSALNNGTGPLASFFAPAGINLVGSKGSSNLATKKTGNGSTVVKNADGTTTTTTVSTHTDMSDARNAEAGESFTIPKTTVVKTTTTDANNNIVKTTNVILDKTVNNKGEQVGTGVAQRTLEFKPGTKNPSNGDVTDIVKSGAVTKTTITSATLDPATNQYTNVQTKSFAPGEKPVLTSSSSSSSSTPSDKVNCDAGTCGTKGSPVCSGAYVFTGGTSTSGKNSDGTYGCVQCNGGSFSSEVKDCNKLIAEGKPVVLPYDANNQWLSNLKTDKMTAPCFINRGGTWVQAAYGQGGEGESTGKVCDGNGQWVAPPKNNPNGPLANIQASGSAGAGSNPKKNVCTGGDMVGLVLNANAVARGNPVGKIIGTINGVATIIDCANSDNPTFTFCRSKAGIDKNGICQPDPNPTNTQLGGTINLPQGEVGAYVGIDSNGTPNVSATLKGPNKIVSTTVGATIGGSAGLLCGPLFAVVCVPAGATVGGWVGNMLGTNSNEAIIGGDVKLGPLGGAGAQINADSKDGLSATANLQTPSEGAANAMTVAGGASLLTPAGIPGFVVAAGGVVSQIAGPAVVQVAKDHPVITGIGAGCTTLGTAGIILGVPGVMGGCIIGSIIGGITGYNYGNATSSDSPTTPSTEKNKDDSGLITPSTVAQGGSSLNTGPINQITTPQNTAGQPAANVSGGGQQFKHFYQGDYGNGIKENGCYLTTGAMIIANYGTVDKGKNPEQLNNEYLQGKPVKSGYINVFSGNAYDKNGIKLVNVAKEAYGNVPTYVANHATSDQPITLAIYCNSCADVGHFVIAVGKNSNGEPMIYDPLKEDQTTPIALNSTNYPGLNFQTTDVFLVETSN